MLYVDGELLFSDKQPVSASADAANVIDSAGVDLGKGEAVHLYVVADGYTGGSLKVDLKTSASVTGQAMASPETVASFYVAADALARGGQVVAARLPNGCKRYLGLSYAAAGGGADGKITAGLNLGTHTND